MSEAYDHVEGASVVLGPTPFRGVQLLYHGTNGDIMQGLCRVYHAVPDD